MNTTISSSQLSSVNPYQVNNVQINQVSPANNSVPTGRANTFSKVNPYQAQMAKPNPVFGNINPFSAPNIINPQGQVKPNSSVFSELDAIDKAIGPNSLISIHRTEHGTPDGLTVQYDPRMVGKILIELAQRPDGASIIGKLRSLLGSLEAGRFQGLKVYTADENGTPRDSGILSGSSTSIGSTQELISPSTQGFNPFSRAGEVMLAWLDVLSMDPSTIPGNTVNVAGTEVPKADLELLNQVLKQNPEIPKALEQFTKVLEIYNKRQEANIGKANNLRQINAKLAQPGGGGGGGGGQAPG